jgi:hypothetical protein
MDMGRPEGKEMYQGDYTINYYQIRERRNVRQPIVDARAFSRKHYTRVFGYSIVA